MKLLQSLLFIAIFLVGKTAQAGYLIRLEYHNKTLVGHGVEMFYCEDNLDSLLFKLCEAKIDTLTERELLATFRLPIDELNLNDKCFDKREIAKYDISKYFFSPKKKVLKVEGVNHQIKMSVIKAEYQICKFRLEYKFFGSYDCSYKEACSLISEPKLLVWNKSEKKHLRAIKAALYRLVSKSER